MKFTCLGVASVALLVVFPFRASAHPLDVHNAQVSRGWTGVKEPCKEIQENVAKWMIDNDIGQCHIFHLVSIQLNVSLTLGTWP